MNGKQSLSSDERTLAALGHGLTFVEGGILGPLVLYLIKKDESPFVAFHCLQSLYFGLALLVVSSVCLVVSFFTLGFGLFVTIPVIVVASVMYIVWTIIAGIKAYEGVWYEIPLVGPLARASHPPR